MKVQTLISFSGGRSSAMMLKKMVEKNEEEYIVCFANTGKEREETLSFVNECSLRWGIPVVWLEYISAPPFFKIVSFETCSRKGEPFAELINKRKNYLPSVVQRYCTADLKVKVMKRYMRSLGFSFWNVALGIRFDEPLRWGKILQNTQKEPFFYVLPLYEERIVRSDVLNFWSMQDFDLNLHSDFGNCDLCFLKGKEKLIKIIREKSSVVDWWIEQENKTKKTFNKVHSFSDLKKIATTQTRMFEEPGFSYPCFCNID